MSCEYKMQHSSSYNVLKLGYRGLTLNAKTCNTNHKITHV